VKSAGKIYPVLFSGTFSNPLAQNVLYQVIYDLYSQSLDNF